MNRIRTPEEIGQMLERGEISRGEAIEMMDERARQEAVQHLYGPADDRRQGQMERTRPTPLEHRAAVSLRLAAWGALIVLAAVVMITLIISLMNRIAVD